MTGERGFTRFLVAGVLASIAVGLLVIDRTPVQAALPESSAVTVSGKGRFADLKVTVDQTKDLGNQVVRVSWTGGAATVPSSGSFGANYLQLMQCWGEDTAGPERTQCQFGGFAGDGRGGAQVVSRQVSYGNLVDPAETIPTADTAAFVPFKGVNGVTVSGSYSDNTFFNQLTSNENPFGRTSPAGFGESYFEMQTAQQAPGLGCGTAKVVSGNRVGRSCWLVVVPRDGHEVDDSLHTGQSSDVLVSSPLAQSNWASRIVIPLDFKPIGLSCPLGSAESQTIGSELISEALSSWQPELCQRTGKVYGYSKISDETGRRKLSTDRPDLVYVSAPVADADVTDQPVVYAPVAVSALVIGIAVDRQSLARVRSEDAEAEKARKEALIALDGRRIEDIKLTPRLVAKLLTQSYRRGSHPQNPLVEKNPVAITNDPEFLALNSDFKDLLGTSFADVLVPFGRSDAAAVLWDYVQGDGDAREWLNGKPDPNGMIVNPNYKGLATPLPEFLKADPFCAKIEDGANPPTPPLCTLDAHPYTSDFFDGARSAQRGDSLSRIWDPNARPAAYKKSPLQLSGTRSLLAITDSPNAERFSLPTVSLRNASGAFVKPTVASMTAAVAGFKPSGTEGVLIPDPRNTRSDAYPLTMLTYAATAPSALTPQAGKEYAQLLNYAVGDGQVLGEGEGQLPFGYAPLPDAQRDQARAAAAKIEADAGKQVATVATPSTGTRSTKPGKSSAGPSGIPSPRVSIAPVTAGSAIPAPVVATPAPSPELLKIASTPAAAVGPERFLVAMALLLGALALVARPVITRLPHRSESTTRMARTRRS